MKQVLTVIVGIVLLLDLALFFGIGVGVGALAAAGPSHSLTNSCLQQNAGQNGLENAGTNPQTGIAFCVLFAQPNGQSYVSNYGPGHVSTPITFSIYNVNGLYGGCNNIPWFAWFVGSGGGPHPAYAEVQIIDGSTGLPISLNDQSTNSFQTQGAVTQSETAWWISYNNSQQESALCRDGYALPSNQTLWGTTSFSLVGPIDDYSIISVRFYTEGPFCVDASIGSSTTPTCDISGPNGVQGNTGDPNGGTWYATTIGQAFLRLGGAAVSWNGQTLYNGQSFTVPVTTFFDQGQGFHVQFLFPAARGAAEIATQTVADNQPSFAAKFTVPSNGAVNSSDPTYNWFQIVVTNPLTQYVYINQPVDISPRYAPPPPSVQVTDTTGSGNVQVGDAMLVQVSANGVPTQGEKITAIYFWAWYLEPGGSVTTLPVAGSSAWISQGGQQGQPLATSTTGYNATASTNFTVGAPYPIEIQVESVTNTGQTSRAATSVSIQVTPPGCHSASCGCTTNCGGGSGDALWEAIGPALLSVAVVLAAFLIALYLPNPYIRYGIIIVGIAFVAASYIFGFYSNWFAAGGILNAGPASGG
jgi:hypothetical protein